MEISVKFPCRKVGTSYVCEINHFYFSASNRNDLAKQVRQFIVDNLCDPVVGMVRHGEDIRITTCIGDRYQIHKTCTSDDGHVMLAHNTTGCLSPNETLLDNMHQQVMHLAQQQWTYGETDPPSWLPDTMRRDWDCWVRFQVAYRIAKEAGCNSQQSHQLACEAMHQ